MGAGAVYGEQEMKKWGLTLFLKNKFYLGPWCKKWGAAPLFVFLFEKKPGNRCCRALLET